jgi:hypothetical protein
MSPIRCRAFVSLSRPNYDFVTSVYKCSQHCSARACRTTVEIEARQPSDTELLDSVGIDASEMDLMKVIDTVVACVIRGWKLSCASCRVVYIVEPKGRDITTAL